MTDSIPLITPPSARLRPALQGRAILPLCPAVVPWGILAGSMALQNGLTPAQGWACRPSCSPGRRSWWRWA